MKEAIKQAPKETAACFCGREKRQRELRLRAGDHVVHLGARAEMGEDGVQLERGRREGDQGIGKLVS